MILADLEHIFRFQTTETEDYIPTGQVDYMIFEGQNRICLLYTSPSPRDRTRSRMPSSA